MSPDGVSLNYLSDHVDFNEGSFWRYQVGFAAGRLVHTGSNFCLLGDSSFDSCPKSAISSAVIRFFVCCSLVSVCPLGVRVVVR